MIFRIHHERAYTVVSNGTIRDDSLSFKATGMLVFLLSMPDDWRPNRTHLAKVKTDGDASVRSAIAELEQAGYVVRQREQLSNGTFEWQYHVYEQPQSQRADFAPPSVGNPPMDGAPVEDQPVLSTEEEEPEDEVQRAASTEIEEVDPIDEAFALWWQHYPNKQGKPLARRSFEKAMKKTGDVVPLAEGLARWCTYWRLRDEPEFIPHPSTWLNREAWNDMPPPITKKASRFDALSVLDDDEDDDPPAGVVDVGSWPT